MNTRRPISEFTLLTVGVSLIGAFANALWLRHNREGGRVQETGYFLFRPLLQHIGLDPLNLFPAGMAEFWHLDRWADLSAFALVATLGVLPLNVLAGSIVWGTLTLVGNRAARFARFMPDIRRAALVAMFLMPAVLLPLHETIYWNVPPRVGFGSHLRWTTFYAAAIGSLVLLMLWAMLSLLEYWRKGRFLAPIVAFGTLATGLLTFGGWLSGLALSPEHGAANSGPNVVLISIDSLRADHLHCYGYRRHTSPNIDQLASEGVLFKTVVAASSWTLPSHMSLLTGLDPLHHGLESDFSHLNDGVVTLAEVLRRAGYTTAGFVSSVYLNARWGFSRGFDTYDDFTLDGSSVTAPTLMRLAGDWLEDWNRRGRKRPFFVFIHVYDVHYDYIAPPPYDRMFDPDYAGAITGKRFIHDERINAGMSHRDLEHIIAGYDSEIRFVDDCLGDLLSRLRKMGAFDNTVLAVTADHGDEFFEHSGKGHRETLYDEVLLIPLIVRYPPRLPKGTTLKQQVRLIDVAPTLVRLAGVKSPNGFGELPGQLYAGRDLTPLTETKNSAQPELPAFSHLSPVFTGNPAHLFAARTAINKLISTQDNTGRPRMEFYELETDPREKHNLADSKSLALRDTLERWKRQNAQQKGRPRKLRTEDLESLKSLGYLK